MTSPICKKVGPHLYCDKVGTHQVSGGRWLSGRDVRFSSLLTVVGSGSLSLINPHSVDLDLNWSEGPLRMRVPTNSS